MPTPTKLLIDQVEVLTAKLALLQTDLEALKAVPITPPPIPVEPIKINEAVLPDSLKKEMGESDVFPSSYREIVDTVLNKSFGIHVKNQSGQFHFAVIVPDKYSTFTPEQKAMNHVDMRLRVIENFLGDAGVKEYVELVYKSFDNERQAMITSDRLSTH